MRDFVARHPLLFIMLAVILWSYACFGPTPSSSQSSPTDARLRQLEQDNCYLKERQRGTIEAVAKANCYR